MKKPRDFRASVLLIMSVLLAIAIFMICSSCASTYQCPAYSGVKKGNTKLVTFTRKSL